MQGIADMVGREEKSRYELLEISDPTSLLVRGNTFSLFMVCSLLIQKEDFQSFFAA